MTLAQKKEYLGKRFVLAGGSVPEDDIDGDDPLEDDDIDDTAVVDDDEDSVPISWHALPITVVTDLCAGFNIKHVIDLCPTPMNLGYELISRGISYFAVCSTAKQTEFLRSQCHKSVMEALVTPGTNLSDPRFFGAAAATTSQTPGQGRTGF